MIEAETKYLLAVRALMQERDFSRAAEVLRIGQSALSKQIAKLKSLLGFPLFVREGRTVVPTPPGEIYAAQAVISLEYAERAVRMARASVDSAATVVHVGKSPYTDPYLITRLLSLRLPFFPRLQIELRSNFAFDLSHELLSGKVELALLTGISPTPRISSVSIQRQSFFVLMLEDDELAWSREVTAEQLSERSCILFDRHVHPPLYEDVMSRVKPASAPGSSLHYVTTAEEASQLVTCGAGVALLAQAGAWRVARDGLTLRPLAVPELVLETRIACRSDSQTRVIGDMMRSYIRGFPPPEAQSSLKLFA